MTATRRAALLLLLPLVLLALPLDAVRAAPVSRNVTLLGHLDNYGGYSACCSYVHSDGREYAILGTTTGTSIVNITNPSAPYEVAFIPGLGSQWREMKQFQNYVYITTEATGGGVQIVRMLDPEHPVLVKTYTGTFNHEHTVSVDSTRSLLILNGTRLDGIQTGMRVLSLTDPENPVEIGAYQTDYVHDSWVRNDTLFASGITSGTMHVVDFSDPTNPYDITNWTYSGARTHSAETSPNGRYLYVCDEQNYGTLKVFDISDLLFHPMVREMTVNPISIVHNVHVKRDTAYVAWYTEGVHLFDLHDPAMPVEWGWYDTYGGFSGGFHGVWEVSANFPSGTFIASDIENGLFIFRANRNYGWVKLLVQDGAQAPISGVDVTAMGESDSTQTQSRGTAGLALSPGTHTLRVRKYGYTTAYVPVTTSVGSHDSIAVTLALPPAGTINGVVRRDSDLTELPGATVEAEGTPRAATSAALGAYSLTGMMPETVRLLADRPGYVPEERTVTVQPGASMTQDFRLLRAAWYDSCDTDKGWSLSAAGDNAIDGLWIRAIPVGSSVPGSGAAPRPGAASSWPVSLAPQHPEPGEGGYNAEGPVQPGDDYTPGTGYCFVTANGPGGDKDPANGDVDGGRTTLTTPPLNMSGMSEPTIAFRRWYYMNTPGEPDSFQVDISRDGVTWVPLLNTRLSHPEWHLEEFRVRDYIVPGSAVRVRFIAQDLGVGSIVEAAVDDFELFDASLHPTGIVEGPPPTPPAVLGVPHPNPSSHASAISLSLRDAATVEVAVYDVQGRRVATLYHGSVPAGDLELVWNGDDAKGRRVASGVYWVRADAAGETFTRRIVRAR
jgi:choice-of-anchor B domain-containing protein